MPAMCRAAKISFPSVWRRLADAAAVVAAVALTVVSAHAQQPGSPPEARVIVTGEGSAQLSPDYARIRGGVTTRGKTVKDATDANSKTMTAVTAALLNAGIAQQDIRTSQFAIHPIYQPQQPSEQPKLAGYNVSNQVTVTVHSIAKVSEILDRMVDAGANDVSSAEFLVSDPSKALDTAREAAIADARRKAELYAHAAGFTLGRVAGISEDTGPVLFPFSPLARAGGAAQPVPISPGENTMRVRLTVGFDIASW